MKEVPEVLFVCVHNAGRSQMAAGLLDRHAQGKVRVRSAGSTPAEEINPAAAEEALEKAKGLAVTPEEQITLLKAQQRARAQLAVARRAKENLH